MKMLQEHWASTVIFIGIFSQCTVAFLACSHILLATEQLRIYPRNDDGLCIPLALLFYWTFLSAFFWINLVSFNVWRSVWFKNFPINDNDLFSIYFGIGFTGPGFVLIVALTAHYIDGFYLESFFGENMRCFGGYFKTWAFFYGPKDYLLALNFLYFGLTYWRLWYRYSDYNSNRLRSFRFNFLLCCRVFFFMGIMSVIEIKDFASLQPEIEVDWSNNMFQDIVHSLQGVLMFIVLVAKRKRVKRLLAERKSCCITFPKSWSACNEYDEVDPALAVYTKFSNAP